MRLRSIRVSARVSQIETSWFCLEVWESLVFVVSRSTRMCSKWEFLRRMQSKTLWDQSLSCDKQFIFVDETLIDITFQFVKRYRDLIEQINRAYLKNVRKDRVDSTKTIRWWQKIKNALLRWRKVVNHILATTHREIRRMKRLKLVNTRLRRTLTIVIATRAKLEEKTMMLRKRLTLAHARLKKKKMNVKKMKFENADEKKKDEKKKKNENENMRKASAESAKDEKKKWDEVSLIDSNHSNWTSSSKSFLSESINEKFEFDEK